MQRTIIDFERLESQGACRSLKNSTSPENLKFGKTSWNESQSYLTKHPFIQHTAYPTTAQPFLHTSRLLSRSRRSRTVRAHRKTRDVCCSPASWAPDMRITFLVFGSYGCFLIHCVFHRITKMEAMGVTISRANPFLTLLTVCQFVTFLAIRFNRRVIEQVVDCMHTPGFCLFPVIGQMLCVFFLLGDSQWHLVLHLFVCYWAKTLGGIQKWKLGLNHTELVRILTCN